MPSESPLEVLVRLDKPRLLRLDCQALRRAQACFGLAINDPSLSLPPSQHWGAVLLWAGCYDDYPRLSFRRIRNLVTAENLPVLWPVITQALCREAGVPYDPSCVSYHEAVHG